MKNQSYKEKIRQLISHKSGVDTREIFDELAFGEDLNLGDLELTEILEELEDLYKINLIDSQREIESVADLMELMEEKLE